MTTDERTTRTWVGPGAKERLAILRDATSVAIVGMSPKTSRSSYFVATYLVSTTPYRVYFVNPTAAGQTVLGQPVYATLADLPEEPDIVDVFRRESEIGQVVDEVVGLGWHSVIWVQLGLWNEEAARAAEAYGLTVVMDRCIKIEHARFHGGLHLAGFDTGQITARKTIR